MSNNCLSLNQTVTSALLSSRNPKTEVLTEPVLQNVLQNLNKAIEQLKHEIFITVDAHQSQFVLTDDQLNQLQMQVESLQNHMNFLEDQFSGDKSESLEAKLEKLKNEFTEERKETERLKHVLDFLQSICIIQKKLNEADNHFQANEYDIAADVLISTKNVLNNISAKCKGEHEIVADLKREYIYRRSFLECRLKEIWQRFFSFNQNTITVQQKLNRRKVTDACEGVNEDLDAEDELSKVELADIFDAMKLLGIAKGQMSNFLNQLIQSVLVSLLHTGFKLDLSQSIESKVSINNEKQSVCWTWLLKQKEIGLDDFTEKNESIPKTIFSTSNQEKEDQDKLQTNIYANVCKALESLACFICEHVFIGQPELMRTFGKLWWRYITENTTNRLPFPSLAAVKLLTDLEMKMQSIQLISEAETRLHLFASTYKKKLKDQKKCRILATVRELIMCDDTIIVNVSDKTEIGSFSNLLREAGIYNRESSGAMTGVGASLDDKFFSSLGERGARRLLLETVAKETDSYLRLPSCGITQNVKKIIDLVHNMLRNSQEFRQHSNKNSSNVTVASDVREAGANIKNRKNEGEVDDEISINEGYVIIRQIITLYIVLFPTAHKERLLSDFHFVAAFFSNCSYLCHHLTTIPIIYNPYIYKAAVSSSSVFTTAIFMDLILLLRRMAEGFYINMMRIKQESITKLMESVEDVQRLSIDSKYTQTESILGDVLQHLKILCNQWECILPFEVLIESISILIDVFIENLLKIVLRSKNLTASDASSLSYLLSSVQSHILSIMQTCVSSAHQRNKHQDVGEVMEARSESHYSDVNCILERMKLQLIINYEAFSLIKILLEADLSMFINKRDQLLKHFSLEELNNLIEMNKNLTVPTEKVLTMLVDGKQSI